MRFVRLLKKKEQQEIPPILIIRVSKLESASYNPFFVFTMDQMVMKFLLKGLDASEDRDVVPWLNLSEFYAMPLCFYCRAVEGGSTPAG